MSESTLKLRRKRRVKSHLQAKMEALTESLDAYLLHSGHVGDDIDFSIDEWVAMKRFLDPHESTDYLYDTLDWPSEQYTRAEFHSITRKMDLDEYFELATCLSEDEMNAFADYSPLDHGVRNDEPDDSALDWITYSTRYSNADTSDEKMAKALISRLYEFHQPKDMGIRQFERIVRKLPRDDVKELMAAMTEDPSASPYICRQEVEKVIREELKGQQGNAWTQMQREFDRAFNILGKVKDCTATMVKMRLIPSSPSADPPHANAPSVPPVNKNHVISKSEPQIHTDDDSGIGTEESSEGESSDATSSESNSSDSGSDTSSEQSSSKSIDSVPDSPTRAAPSRKRVLKQPLPPPEPLPKEGKKRMRGSISDTPPGVDGGPQSEMKEAKKVKATDTANALVATTTTILTKRNKKSQNVYLTSKYFSQPSVDADTLSPQRPKSRKKAGSKRKSSVRLQSPPNGPSSDNAISNTTDNTENPNMFSRLSPAPNVKAATPTRHRPEISIATAGPKKTFSALSISRGNPRASAENEPDDSMIKPVKREMIEANPLPSTPKFPTQPTKSAHPQTEKRVSEQPKARKARHSDTSTLAKDYRDPSLFSLPPQSPSKSHQTSFSFIDPSRPKPPIFDPWSSFQRPMKH
ncbi:hypothetical protein P152DRAFT_242643 [Eremomyces bilateralis CBS 781.70]|uniref:Uncharacterized protein n=1 Tax=Eremomyces bilateralis CBS 781.70 TaxID=1392243 RepID=A0A6G1GAU0_9PEZI|nr:uncharacterized protein P152DRAFT_242643 [Eremomyces bilateralis CBS 781.70]KAF1815020.1 hypothetical protein P152DRAFT_242643 [Eremomyces bilateralis CBS 781.70]